MERLTFFQTTIYISFIRHAHPCEDGHSDTGSLRTPARLRLEMVRLRWAKCGEMAKWLGTKWLTNPTEKHHDIYNLGNW